MCGRFGLYLEEGFEDRFGVDKPEDLPLSYNIAPGMTTAVITKQSPKRVQLMKWGLLPPWAKDPRIAYSMINARAETITEKPAFRRAIKSQRCLVPANYFYEWKRVGKDKQPYLFHDSKAKYFAMAGLYEVAHDAEKREVRTFTIITTQANAVVGQIHNRMPVILDQMSEEVWLDKDSTPEQTLKLLKPYQSQSFESYPVSQSVNSARNDEASLIEPIGNCRL